MGETLRRVNGGRGGVGETVGRVNARRCDVGEALPRFAFGARVVGQAEGLFPGRRRGGAWRIPAATLRQLAESEHHLGRYLFGRIGRALRDIMDTSSCIGHVYPFDDPIEPKLGQGESTISSIVDMSQAKNDEKPEKRIVNEHGVKRELVAGKPIIQ